MHGINPEEHEYIPIPLQNRQKFDFYQEKLARRNEEIEKRGKLSLTIEERKIWLTKLRLQTRDIVNSTSIGAFSNMCWVKLKWGASSRLSSGPNSA